MTRDELREKVARAICYSDMNEDVFDGLSTYQKEQFICNADAAIDTIFAALKEPTEEMILSGGEYVISVGSIDCMHAGDRPEFGIKGRETGSYELFKAMLSASPIAPREE